MPQQEVLPYAGKPKPRPEFPKLPNPAQLEPIGHAGAAPTSQRRRMQLQSQLTKTPVNPLPDKPPLLVKTVTV
jgi:hypothetical protein